MTKVLVVDDEESIRFSFQKFLTNAGFEVAAVSHPSEAKKILASNEFDVAVVDRIFPEGQDGLDLVKYIKDAQPFCQIILISAYPTFKSAAETLKYEAFAYLTKPVKREEICKVVGEAARKSRVVRDLKYHDALFYSLFGSSLSGIVICDLQGRTEFVNPAFTKIFGYEKEEVLGRCIPYVPDSDLKKTESEIKDLLDGKPVPHRETQRLTKDGKIIEVSQNIFLCRDREGHPISIIVILQDITEQKKMEAQLQQAQKMEAIGTLAGGIAHDFNNILLVILGNISLAKMRLSPEEEVFKRLEEAEKASLRARDLTQQLLTFSQEGAPVKKTGSIVEILKDSAMFVLRGSNVRCQFFIPDDLWTVEMDEGQMSQVINNLVINAIEAMPEGGMIKVKAENITVEKEKGLPLKAGKYIKISIEDQGTGISKEHLPKIFDPYFTTKQKGSGLGLATAYSIVKRHDGYISVESKLGVGTTFYIYLPASEKRVPKRKAKKDEILSGEGKVLLMDDDEAIRKVAGNMLKHLGYEVEFAEEGAQAIELYKKARESGDPFDLVILDLTVPGGMGGKEAIKRLREVDPGVKAIVSSGYSNDPIIAEFKKYGFSGVVAKPYKIKELSEELRKVMMVE